MNFIVEIVISVIGEIVGEFFEGGLRSVFGEKLFTSETWESFGTVGAVAVGVLSLGGIRWACHDRKAVVSGMVLVAGGLVSLALGGLHWWKLHA